MRTGRTTRTSALALLIAWSALFAAGVTTLHAQDFAVQSLEDSPRHHEWVEVEAEGRTVHAFMRAGADPEASATARAANDAAFQRVLEILAGLR